MPPSLPSVLSLLPLLLLAPLSQPVNAAPTAQTETPAKEKAPCDPEPCASMPLHRYWTPFCDRGALFCTAGPGMITMPMGKRCEEWCQPEPPKPKCPAPRPPPAENCKRDPCVGLPAEGWEPYCYQGALYCTVGPGMITVAVGRCEEWCQPEPKKPAGCP